MNLEKSSQAMQISKPGKAAERKQPWEFESERDERQRETALLVEHGMWEQNQCFRQGYFSGPSAFGKSSRGILWPCPLYSFWTISWASGKGLPPNNHKTVSLLLQVAKAISSTLSRTSSPPQGELSKVLHRFHSGQWRVGFHIVQRVSCCVQATDLLLSIVHLS